MRETFYIHVAVNRLFKVQLYALYDTKAYPINLLRESSEAGLIKERKN